MQASPRQQELERAYHSRRGHAPQISISDDNHHVTEAIGSYYEEQESPGSDPRPLSYLPAAAESFETTRSSRRQGSVFDPQKIQTVNTMRPHPVRSSSRETPPQSPEGERMSSPISASSLKRMGSANSPTDYSPTHGTATSPSLKRQNSGDTAVQPFPLNDIDYESSPAAVAQELSNLQAIRRMSMNVDLADPDLPSFSSSFGGIPTVAPRHGEGEDDASQLFWVPARLHPELAPKEFKTFVEDRVEKIRRRSGGEETLTADGLERSLSRDSNLRRKKSMLSHSIDTKGSYEDGAERLERKRSQGDSLEPRTKIANLADLETLVSDPERILQRMSLDATRSSEDSGEQDMQGDMPILPPVGQSLKRSTRTAYRRGSLRKGERMPFSKRLQQRHAESDVARRDSEEDHSQDYPLKTGVTRVQTEPIPPRQQLNSSEDDRDHQYAPADQYRRQPLGTSQSSDNFAQTRQSPYSRESSNGAGIPASQPVLEPQQDSSILAERPPRTSSHQQPRSFQSRLASGPGRTTAQLPGYSNTDPVPKPVGKTNENAQDVVRSSLDQAGPQQSPSLPQQFPERKSSQDVSRTPMQLSGPYLRPAPERAPSNPSSLEELSSYSSTVPGNNDTRTDALTMIPTFETKKPEKKESGRKSSWKWILGNDDDDKKAKEDRSLDSRLKIGKAAKQQATEKARLDVLQHSIDSVETPRGRESLVLNRTDFKLTDEDRKRDGKRQNESRKDKEKEPGLLQAIFGGKKKTSEGDLREKKRKPEQALSSEPPAQVLRPDIDYNWTRFSILEERAIYRMAHIKLANPRRPLHSQVLLSNFMYSYLAKVQLMHPQTQIATSPQMRQQQAKGQPQKSSEPRPAEYDQYQRWQAQQARQDEMAQSSSNSDGAPKDNRRTSFEIATGEPHAAYPTVHAQPSSTGYDRDENNMPHSAAGYDYQGSNIYDQQYRSQEPARRSHDNGSASYGNDGAGRPNGSRSTYGVASTHDYLGYAKDEQPFGSNTLWDDEKVEDLW